MFVSLNLYHGCFFKPGRSLTALNFLVLTVQLKFVYRSSSFRRESIFLRFRTPRERDERRDPADPIPDLQLHRRPGRLDPARVDLRVLREGDVHRRRRTRFALCRMLRRERR